MMNDAIETVQGWGEISWLRHGFSTRLGGVSTAYGASDLNLGWTASDDPANVRENRARLQSAVNAAQMPLVAVRQVHSDVVQVVRDAAGPFATEDGKAILEGDGIMTKLPGLLLGVQVADCVPVIVIDRERKAIAAFHAGWRGTVKRIVEKGIAVMQYEYGSCPETLLAAIGPCIGSCCYVVGEEVRAEFTSQFTHAPELFREHGSQLHLDLWEANRRQLLDAGLRAENITVLQQCSACTRTEDGHRKYFSHRDEKGFTGRMMAVVGIA